VTDHNPGPDDQHDANDAHVQVLTPKSGPSWPDPARRP
jgi:hypothetical protein